MNVTRHFSSLLIGSMIAAAGSAQAQQDEIQLVQGMRGLAATWQSLSQTGEVLIIACPNNLFTGVKLAAGASVSVDLQRTDSLMNPYLGIVRITGRFQRNASRQDGSCSPSVAEAKSSQDWHDNDRDYDYTIYYQVNGAELWLTDGNEVFRNNFMSQPGNPQVDVGTSWLHAFRFPIP